MPTSPGLSTTWGQSQYSDLLIEALILQSALLRSGATHIPTDARVLFAPRLKVHPAAAWVAEMQEIPSDSGDADTLVLTPRKVGNVLTLSTESIEDAPLDELTAVGNAMVKGIGVQIDAAAFSSNAATATVPAGLLSYVLPGTGSGGVIDIDHILAGVGAIQGVGGNPDTCFLNPADQTKLRQLKATTGQYILAPDAADVEGSPAVRVAGTQLIPTAGLAAGHALVCEARFVEVALRRDMSVEFSSDAAFTSDSVVARVTCRIDFAPGDPNAFWLISP
jgi:HK97 family phage major capsid protein